MTFSDEPDLRLELQTNADTSAADLAAGLQDWLDLGLLDDAGINAVLAVTPDHPALLTGLEHWLQRGLLSEQAIRTLCEAHLVCAIAPVASPVSTGASGDFLPFDENESTASSTPQKPIIKGRSPNVRLREKPEIAPSWLARMAQSLMAELSVLWVLLLGIALVVLSSGVIAAQQWRNVPPVGQYSILWVYTLMFGGVGLWLQRRPRVQLTAQALQWVAVLLLPVNMVAIDRIGFANGNHLAITAIATLTLTGLTLLIFQRLGQIPWLGRLNYLALSYLHWGWHSSQWAIAAVYGGIVLTGGLTVAQTRRRADLSVNSRLSVFHTGLLIYGILVLVGRSLFIEQLPFTTFALAIGLCGALIAWNAQFSIRLPESPTQVLPMLMRPLTWEWVGGGLILLGWLIAVDDAPAQAIALSGLGFWFFGRRYLRSNAVADWLMLGVIGIQLHGLVWAVLPSTLRQNLLTIATQATGTEETPWALLGLVFLPFLAVMLILTVRVHRDRPSPTLLHWMMFGFGTVLVGLSLANPATRSLNGMASTLLLGTTTVRYLHQGGDRSQTEARSGQILPDFTAQPLIYLTHLASVLTALSCIDWTFPVLGVIPWAQILLGLTMLEWGISYGLAQRSTSPARSIVQSSAWNLGIWLAIAGYALLLSNAIAESFGSSQTLGRATGSVDWGILWLAVPAMLTFLGSQATVSQGRRSLWLSTLALLAMPLVTIPSEAWQLWSLAIATGLMITNSVYLQRTLASAIALGFGITFIIACLLNGIFGLPTVQGDGWLVVWVALIAGLWGLQFVLQNRTNSLAQTYKTAADGWAIALMILVLLASGDRAFYEFPDPTSPPTIALLALAGLMGAIAFRHWQQATHWTLVCGAIALELFVIQVMPLVTVAPSALVVVNVALGLGWVFLGERQTTLRASWNAIPLGYVLCALGFRLDQFAPWTGWTTLGIALIVMGVGRRGQAWRPLASVGLAIVSVGVYEIAAALAPDSTGDRAVVMAAASVALLGVYRLGDRWIASYLTLASQSLTLGANLHWLIGSGALIAAIPHPIRHLSALAILTGFLLTGYALEQGRHQEVRSPDIWVYLGILEACGLVVYLVDQVLPETIVQTLVPWIGAIAAGIASGFYLAPWETWGWNARPWRRAAVVLPLGAIALTLDRVHPGSLLIAAGCYTLLAQLRHQVRLTYLSILLVNWAIAQWVRDGALDRPMLYASLAGLSLLYLAQVEPLLQDPQQRHARHWVRCLGVGTICLFALLFHHESGVIPALVSLAAIFIGLTLRTRAFLYVGTITFLLNAFYQLVILIFAYSLLKWIVGLVAGVALIWIAATFETRREQMGSLLRQWFIDLRDWQ